MYKRLFYSLLLVFILTTSALVAYIYSSQIKIHSEKEAYSSLEAKIGKNKDKCIFFQEEDTKDYYQIEAHGYQNDKDCLGDPHVSPLLSMYRISKQDGIVERYDVINDKFDLVK